MNARLIMKVLPLLLCLGILAGCGEKKETVLIYTSMEGYRVEHLNERLMEEFPQYEVIVEYMSTGNQAAKLLAEGTQTDCDITHNLEYGYMMQLDQAGFLADLSAYDKDIFAQDTIVSENIIPQERNGGSIIVNTELLVKKNLPEPACYEDLLRPEYEGLISMPSPKASGTGYMFLKSLVNTWGEEEAFAYFDKLTPNILQYTSSGSGPLNAVIQGEAVIGLAMTGPSVNQLNEGQPLKFIPFPEGSPYSLYGQGIIKGKDVRPAVQEVFRFLVEVYNDENCSRSFPEKLYKDRDYIIENYPQNIRYADMSNNTIDEKNRLLEKWKY